MTIDPFSAKNSAQNGKDLRSSHNGHFYCVIVLKGAFGVANPNFQLRDGWNNFGNNFCRFPRTDNRREYKKRYKETLGRRIFHFTIGMGLVGRWKVDLCAFHLIANDFHWIETRWRRKSECFRCRKDFPYLKVLQTQRRLRSEMKSRRKQTKGERRVNDDDLRFEQHRKPRKEKCFRVDESNFSHLLLFIRRVLFTTSSFQTGTFTTNPPMPFSRKWMPDMIPQSLRLLKNFMINTFWVPRDVLRSQLHQRSTSTSESIFFFETLDGSYRVVCCEIVKHKLCCRTWQSISKLGRRLGETFERPKVIDRFSAWWERRGRYSVWFMCVMGSHSRGNFWQPFPTGKNTWQHYCFPIACNKTPAISDLEKVKENIFLRPSAWFP